MGCSYLNLLLGLFVLPGRKQKATDTYLGKTELKREDARHVLRAGLEMMLKDGSLDGLVWMYKGNAITNMNGGENKLIRVRPPFSSDAVPLDRTELWHDPLERSLEKE